MSIGLNRVMLLGNLGADPELRSTQGGDAVLRLRMAMTERYLDRSKAWQERTEWANVTVWGKRGEALSRILTKGSTVFVEGSLRTSSYEKDGQKVWKTEIVAKEIVLVGGKPSGERGDGPSPREKWGDGQPEGGSSKPASKDDGGDPFDDDFGGL